jgi:hypothetical protein
MRDVAGLVDVGLELGGLFFAALRRDGTGGGTPPLRLFGVRDVQKKASFLGGRMCKLGLRRLWGADVGGANRKEKKRGGASRIFLAGRDAGAPIRCTLVHYFYRGLMGTLRRWAWFRGLEYL